MKRAVQLVRSHARQPVEVLMLSVLAALIFMSSVWLLLPAAVHPYALVYWAPIGVVFVAFALTRLAGPQAEQWRSYALDGLVVALALARGIFPIPGFSGHALFLSHALLTGSSRLVQVLAGLVLVEVAYLKLVEWQDPTLLGGWRWAC